MSKFAQGTTVLAGGVNAATSGMTAVYQIEEGKLQGEMTTDQAEIAADQATTKDLTSGVRDSTTAETQLAQNSSSVISASLSAKTANAA